MWVFLNKSINALLAFQGMRIDTHNPSLKFLENAGR